MMPSFEEITEHLLKDKTPSQYFEEAYKNGEFKESPFNKLVELRNTEQELTHHPEGNVWNHTMLVLDNGAKIREESKNPKVFMWSLLLHDIGKASTTKKRKGRWTSYDHDKVGERIGGEFLKEICNDKRFIKEVESYIRYHMHYLYIKKNLPFADIKGMKKRCDFLELKLVFISDRLGRGGLLEENKKKITKEIKEFKLEI